MTDSTTTQALDLAALLDHARIHDGLGRGDSLALIAECRRLRSPKSPALEVLQELGEDICLEHCDRDEGKDTGSHCEWCKLTRKAIDLIKAPPPESNRGGDARECWVTFHDNGNPRDVFPDFSPLFPMVRFREVQPEFPTAKPAEHEPFCPCPNCANPFPEPKPGAGDTAPANHCRITKVCGVPVTDVPGSTDGGKA